MRFLQVSGYSNGLRISTGYDNAPGGGRLAAGVGAPLEGAVVTGMTFSRLGSRYSARDGYAAVHLQNTVSAVVHGNAFDRIENGGESAGLIHGVYAVVSASVEVSENRFDHVSGDAIRTRHGTSGAVFGNSIERSGRYAAVSDWFCGTACASKGGTAVECASGALVVQENVVGANYRGGPLHEFARTVASSEAGVGCP